MRRLGFVAVWTVLLLPPPAAATPQTAPGRLVFPVAGPPVFGEGRVPGGFIAGTALADGRLVLLQNVNVRATPQAVDLQLYRLLADGTPDGSFGRAGIATIRLPPAPAGVLPLGGPGSGLQVLDGGGRVLVVAVLHSTVPYATPPIVIIALSAGGELDPAFGVGGYAQSGVGFFGGSSPAAVTADRRIAVAGATGTPSVVENGILVSSGEQHWSVARLLPDGRPDPSFGTGGVAALAGVDAVGGGTAVTVLRDGGLASIGTRASGSAIVRLLVDGTPDPSFNGGLPARLTTGWAPGPALERPDGALDLATLASDWVGSIARVERVSRAGVPGLVVMPLVLSDAVRAVSVLPTGDGGELLMTAPLVRASAGAQVLAMRALLPDGSLGPPLTRPVPFGGGRTTAIEAPFRYSQPSVDQSYLVARSPFAAPGGRVVVPGAVLVAQPAGEEDSTVSHAAVTVLTSALRLDQRFGGPLRRATLTVARLRGTNAVTAGDRPSMTVGLRTGSPGVAEVQVRARGRLLARATIPVWNTGRALVDVLLTRAGARQLGRGRALDVRVTTRFRDLLGSTATAHARGTASAG